MAKYGIDETKIRAWTKQQEEKNERVIMEIQGKANYCSREKYMCTGALATVNSAYVKGDTEGV